MFGFVRLDQPLPLACDPLAQRTQDHEGHHGEQSHYEDEQDVGGDHG